MKLFSYLIIFFEQNIIPLLSIFIVYIYYKNNDFILLVSIIFFINSILSRFFIKNNLKKDKNISYFRFIINSMFLSLISYPLLYLFKNIFLVLLLDISISGIIYISIGLYFNKIMSKGTILGGLEEEIDKFNKSFEEQKEKESSLK